MSVMCFYPPLFERKNAMNKTVLSKLSAAAFAAFALSGCHLTGAVLDASEYTEPETVVTEENIYSFGFTKPDSKNLPANRLVMLGEKTAYVTDVTSENDLVKALRATELSKQFEIVNGYNHPVTLSVSLHDDNRFYASTDVHNGKSRLCLAYRFEQNVSPALKKRETAVLNRLDFKVSGSIEQREQKSLYTRCYPVIGGQTYAMNAPLPAEYRFKTPVGIKIKSQKGQYELSGAKIAKKVVLTPFAIIGDIIMLPLAPFMWPRGSKI